MVKPVLFLRISYWLAAIADFGIAVLVWMPERMGVDEIVYPMVLTSAIAFSWGLLLLVADRKPLERRWVLIPTIVVVTLITITRTMFSVFGNIEFSITLLLFGIALVFFMAYSYYCAEKQETENRGTQY